MNTKQSKFGSSAASTPPPVSKPSARPSAAQLKAAGIPSANDSIPHFQWPTPVPKSTTSITHPQVTTTGPSALDTSYNQSGGSRLPPINALSQSRIPSQQISASSAAYLSSAASLANYTTASLANYTSGTPSAAALAANYASYSQFPMFPLAAAAGLTDMSSLNPNALTGLAMQGLHGAQQYYRSPADSSLGHNAVNANPSL